MAKGKSSSAAKKAQYQTYKTQNRWAKNKQAQIQRHLKKYPNDVQAQAALKNISGPKRKTPTSRVWSASARATAEMYSKVGINGIHALNNHRLSQKVGDGEHMRYAETEESKKRAAKKNKTKAAA